MSYGEKIVELRKSKGMTQATLGEQLNVTYQAVSKWERDESDPDFATMSKIAKLFGVPITYFEDEEVAVAQPAAEVAESPAEAVQEAPQETRTVFTEELRNEIREEMRAEAERARQESEKARKEAERKAIENKRIAREQQEAYEKSKVIRRRNIGLIAGGILTVAALALTIVLMVYSSEPVSPGIGVASCFGVLVLGYTFFSQLFWDGVVLEVLLCGGKIVGMPGVIFSFDLDGFIFLIVIKIIFAIIKMLFFVLTLLFFLIIAVLISPFTFAPAIIKLSRGIELG